jgi:CheY-like chemotaxis protein
MDLIMPEMDGIQATAEIRKFEKSIPGTFKTIIIAQTACLLDMEYDDALKAGCNDFLIKPLSLRWVMHKIKDWGNIQVSLHFQEDKFK